MSPSSPWAGAVEIAADGARLEGELRIPDRARGLVLFSHGSGSSRHSPRNRRVAELLQHAGFGTLLFDLLTRDEERSERFTGHLRFDIPLLASRLENATRWAMADARTASFPLGYFGASTGAAAALIAAAVPDLAIHAVVSRGGRPDLAADALERVRAPTLLIVGGADDAVIPLNQSAYARLRTTKRLELVRGATHLFEEPGALERVAMLATRWFQHYLIFA
ncbi:MAG: dienelactone hydrolase family protein [Opitutae bacterium]|nr:dienelactone hydrolase family protein [Opitutae bacterium]